jgi:ADP-heptose:LPS heptosyltransferase
VKRIEIFFRRFLLKLLLLFSRKPEKHELNLSSDSKILFIRLNRIGDALVVTPLLQTIKKEFNCQTYVLASKSNWFVFDNKNLADEIIIFDKKKIGLFGLIRLLNSKKFDAVIDLHDDISSTVSYIVAFMKVKYKIGLKKETEKLYTHTVDKLNPEKYHVIDRAMRFANVFNIRTRIEDINIVFEARNEEKAFTEDYLKNHFFQNIFLIGINISAGSEARFWGVDNYRELIKLLKEYDVNILLMCVERDINYAIAISNGTIPVYYNSEFDKFSAMVANLDLLITPDTSIVHIGSAYKKPVFGFFVKYNTTNMIWSPYKSVFECVVTEEPTLKNVKLENVKEKLIPFFEKLYYEYSTKQE